MSGGKAWKTPNNNCVGGYHLATCSSIKKTWKWGIDKPTSTSPLNCSRSSGKVESIIIRQAGSVQIQIHDGQEGTGLACVAGGFLLWISLVFRKERDNTASKLNTGHTRKLWGGGRVKKAEKIGINLGIWETAHLPLPWANINTYFSLEAKCWLRAHFPIVFLFDQFTVSGMT